MAELNWRNHQEGFTDLADLLISGDFFAISTLPARITRICENDPSSGKQILGVDSSILAFLEYLFFRAEGPYSPDFVSSAHLIRLLCQSSPSLGNLLNLNSADAIGNMILNKRGRLKFAIADHLELLLLLEWWPRFGLNPVSLRQVFETVIQKNDVNRRLSVQDPVIILRLLEVFPIYRHEFCPDDLSLEDLKMRQNEISPLPSHRRYHQLLGKYLKQGMSICDVIRQEEKRILPIQVSRNTFLSYLVKKMHQDTCQICSISGMSLSGSEITVHHIIPLSEGGCDIARNMLVVCLSHHRAIHAGEIIVSIHETVEIRTPDIVHHLMPNP
jgi:hypothetical protein